MIKCNNKKNKKSSGFIMIQVLLGLVILIALMTGWAYYQNRVYQRTIATRITNEMNFILEAATSYQMANNNHWPEKIAVLIQDGYLKPQTPGDTKMYNPYGKEYILSEPPGIVSKLELQNNIPKQYRYISQIVMGALPFASLDTKTLPNDDILTVDLDGVNPQGIVTTVESGTTIDCPKCVGSSKPRIFTSVASCGDPFGQPISACRTYATLDVDKEHWTVHMRALTNAGWQELTDKYDNAQMGRIQVITKCE